MTTEQCWSCNDPRYLGWTAGSRADGDDLAARLVTLHGCAAEVVRCGRFGYDVLRSAR